VAVAHLAFDLGAGHERRNRVDHHDIHRAGANQRLRNLQGLLARVRLRDVQLIHVDAAAPRIVRVQCVLDVDERRDAAHLLRLGDDVLADGRLTRGFGPIDLGDATAWHATDPKRQIQRKRTGGNGGDLQALCLTQLHDSAFTEALLQTCECRIKCLNLAGFGHEKVPRF